MSKGCLYCGSKIEHTHLPNCPLHFKAPARKIKIHKFEKGQVVIVKGVCFKVTEVRNKILKLKLWK